MQLICNVLYGFVNVIEQSEIICEIQVCKSSVVSSNTNIFDFNGFSYHKVCHHKKKNGESIQPCLTPDTILNMSVSPSLVFKQQLQFLYIVLKTLMYFYKCRRAVIFNRGSAEPKGSARTC